MKKGTINFGFPFTIGSSMDIIPYGQPRVMKTKGNQVNLDCLEKDDLVQIEVPSIQP